MRTWKHDFYRHIFDPVEYPAFDRGPWGEIQRFNAMLKGAHWHYHGTIEQAHREEAARMRQIRDAAAALRGPVPKDKADRLDRRRRQYAAKAALRRAIKSNAALANRTDAKTFWQAQAMAGAV